jgi:two-component system, OmpR family, KDP operon response regulator KdpE
MNRDSPDTLLRAGELIVDLGTRRVRVPDRDVRPSPIEYRLLATLVRHAGRVPTHRQLLQEVWGPGYTDQTEYLRLAL